MRIVGRQKLEEFTAKHADARPWVENWTADAELSEWKTPQDIKGKYASASFLAENVVVFNMKGNRYRLEVLIAYRSATLVVRNVETHAEYSKPRRRKK